VIIRLYLCLRLNIGNTHTHKRTQLEICFQLPFSKVRRHLTLITNIALIPSLIHFSAFTTTFRKIQLFAGETDLKGEWECFDAVCFPSHCLPAWPVGVEMRVALVTIFPQQSYDPLHTLLLPAKRIYSFPVHLAPRYLWHRAKLDNHITGPVISTDRKWHKN